MSVIDRYHHKHFLKYRHGFYKRPVTERKLVESDDTRKAFETLISEVTLFFEEKRAEVIELDMSSPERAMVESALGILKQANDPADTTADIRSRIATLREGLQGLIEGADTGNSLYKYVSDTIANLSTLYIQAGDTMSGDQTDGMPDEGGESGVDVESPDAAPDVSPDAGQDPENPDDEESSDDSLAKALGFAK